MFEHPALPNGTNFVHMWEGKLLSECSRDELIECIEHLSTRLADFTTPHAIQALALGQVEIMRRGRPGR